MTSQGYNENGYTRLSYDYGNLANMEEQTLTITGLEIYCEYTNHYDMFNNRVDKTQIYSVFGCKTTNYKTTNYNYDTQGRISGLDYGSYDIEYVYDKMGRLSNRTVTSLYSHYSTPVNEDYLYKTYGNGYTTNLLTFIDDQTNVDNDRSAAYDENGYVTSVTYNGKNVYVHLRRRRPFSR